MYRGVSAADVPDGACHRATQLDSWTGEPKRKMASSLPSIGVVEEVDRMAYRTFLDSDGVEWHAWDVLPKALERRVAERRIFDEVHSFPERRRAERRQLDGCGTPLTSGLREGWLCFDAGNDRRRLSPIPADWEDCGHRTLESYCRLAMPARLSPARRR